MKKTKKTKKTKKLKKVVGTKTKVPEIQDTSIRGSIEADYPDTPLFFMDPANDYDKTILGIIEGKAHKSAVAYDYDKVIQANIAMGMNYEEAVEYFCYNQIDAYVGEHTPVFIKLIQGEQK